MSIGVNSALKFADDLQTDEYFLFEVSEAVLKQVLAQKDTVQLRGRPDDPCVLVTDESTYSVRQVESTNTMMLIPPLPADTMKSSGKRPRPDEKTEEAGVVRVIQGMVTCHYELTLLNPSLNPLRDLLNAVPYNGEEDEQELGMGREGSSQEYETKRGVFTTQRLREVIQASDSELYQNLEKINAVEIGGYWRLLHPDYDSKVFDAILDLVSEHQWATDAVSAAAVAEQLQTDFSETVSTHVLRCYSLKQDPEDDKDIFRLDVNKVALFRAIQLFVERNPYPYLLFMRQWEDVMPYGMVPHPDMLKGHAVVESTIPSDADKSGKQWSYFPVGALASEPRQRLRQLFQKRERWSFEAIAPYVADLPAPGQPLDQFLLKNTRVVNTAEGPLYTKRY